eukprot:TRINITY_DN16319_c0_g1_i10.p2 TRINITY_DN16319_c0_g1~~TRINITY_DN16319_c0_g1_i10.p2  ORF type:complete len:132 (+),score=11.10 TRINITY_DN16319_c0_g1_i10:183-578(+)
MTSPMTIQINSSTEYVMATNIARYPAAMLNPNRTIIDTLLVRLDKTLKIFLLWRSLLKHSRPSTTTPSKIQPRHPKANFNLESRTQDSKNKMTQALLLFPETWKPFMYMSVPVPGRQKFSSFCWIVVTFEE